MAKLRWGIIGTGRIAKIFADGILRSETGKLVAVGSRSKVKAREFARANNIAQAHASYEALLADPNVEAVYIATPHPHHKEWAIRAAEAKKHILCEKPVGVHYDEAAAMMQAAWENSVFFMEAYMYRCHPQIARMIELIRAGTIGQVKVIRASIGSAVPYDLQNPLFNREMGGGGILDNGGFCTSMTRLIAGVAVGKPFAEAERLSVFGEIGVESEVDEYAVAMLVFPNDIIATISCGLRLQQENKVRVEGTGGALTLPDPWVANVNGGETKLILERNEEEPETLTVTSQPLYAIEADLVAYHVAKGDRQAASPAMSWADSLGNIRLQDEWRRAMDAPEQFTLVQPVAQTPFQ